MVQRQRPGYQQQQGDYYSTQIFYDELSPYGDWVHNREYGYVWIPHVGRNFYPYATNGQWVMTEYGWTWLSDYEWGWAPFHYGRWDYDLYYGWVWFPDTEWAPAWVTWRRGEGYFGWSPMRPGMYTGRGFGNDYNQADIDRWIFVRERDFMKSNIGRYYVNRRRNDEILRSTRIIDNVRNDDQRRVSYYSGPNPSEVQQATGKRIRSVSVRDNERPGNRLSNNQLQIYRPRVANNASQGNRPAPSRITDIKDIRPMRERNRDFQPGIIQDDNVNQNVGQGQRSNEPTPEQVLKERDVKRQYEEKINSRQKRKEEIEAEQQQRSRDSENQMRRVQKENRQQQAERKQQTDQQKEEMQKERKRQEEASDTSLTRRVVKESRNTARRRR